MRSPDFGQYRCDTCHDAQEICPDCNADYDSHVASGCTSEEELVSCQCWEAEQERLRQRRYDAIRSVVCAEVGHGHDEGCPHA